MSELVVPDSASTLSWTSNLRDAAAAWAGLVWLSRTSNCSGRPSTPPVALIFFSENFIPCVHAVPKNDHGPLSSVTQPILIGSPLCARAGMETRHSAVAAARERIVIFPPNLACAPPLFLRG